MEAVVSTQRFASQLLTGSKPKSARTAVAHLLAVQAQDPRGMRLALRPRTQSTTGADVDALLGSGDLVVGWLCRGTLHLVSADDYWWLHALTTPQLATGTQRRLKEEGVTTTEAERGVAIVARELAGAACTRTELREALDSAGIPTRGQALFHVLSQASHSGVCVRGPSGGKEQTFVDPREWIGPQPTVDVGRALGQLATRYLQGHSPADERDLAKWAGITLTAARSGMKTAVEAGVTMTGMRSERQTESATPHPLLLGAFDPLLLGWASRDWVVGDDKGIVTTNGIFRPFALVDGKACALWSLADSNITVTPFTELPSEVERRLMTEAQDVRRYLGLSNAPSALLSSSQ